MGKNPRRQQRKCRQKRSGVTRCQREKGKGKGKKEEPPPLTLTSVEGESAALELESSDDAYGEAYNGPETVFVRVSDSGELLLESEGHPLENIKSESRSVAKSKTKDNGNNAAARKTAAGKRIRRR